MMHIDVIQFEWVPQAFAVCCSQPRHQPGPCPKPPDLGHIDRADASRDYLVRSRRVHLHVDAGGTLKQQYSIKMEGGSANESTNGSIAHAQPAESVGARAPPTRPWRHGCWSHPVGQLRQYQTRGDAHCPKCDEGGLTSCAHWAVHMGQCTWGRDDRTWGRDDRTWGSDDRTWGSDDRTCTHEHNLPPLQPISGLSDGMVSCSMPSQLTKAPMRGGQGVGQGAGARGGGTKGR